MDPAASSSLLRSILSAFYKVYNTFGYGFLEVHYATALEIELRKRGVDVAREFAVQVYYEGIEIGFHRLDMVVAGAVVVELKAGVTLPLHARSQLYNYLRATNLECGLLLHFGPAPRFQKVFVLNPPAAPQASRHQGR